MWTRRLQDEIRRQKISYRQLAARSGISLSTIKQYGKAGAAVTSPHGDKLDRLADALGVNRKWLQTGDGPRYPASRAEGGTELIDEALLTRIIELVEHESASRSCRLTPEIYARLVCFCYQQELRVGDRTPGNVDVDAVMRALRLVS